MVELAVEDERGAEVIVEKVDVAGVIVDEVVIAVEVFVL